MQKQFEIFWRFLVLGLTSFGGPAAHIGYFRQAFVEKSQWLTEKHYGQLIALSQFLPGPASSQVGFAIGLHRGGLIGATSAFIAFTLPSFLLLYALAVGMNSLHSPLMDGFIHGLKLLALVVVTDAIIGMWKNFCPTLLTRFLAILTALCLLLFPSFYLQIAILLIMAIIGALFLKQAQQSQQTANQQPFGLVEKLWLVAMLGLFFLSFVAWQNELLQLFAQFYQAGSLVFGGGHVVLPLLQHSLAEGIKEESFLTAYAAAQAVPGPMFTLASFLGAELFSNSPFLGALIATLAIFLPGFLLVLALHRYWQKLAINARFAGVILAVNASVVGFLLATLVNPILPSALLTWHDLLAAVIGLWLLKQVKLSVLWLIGVFIVYGSAMTL